MDLKLCIAGPSGTGKSTLAEYISKVYDIPFITTSTKPLWDKYGITSHHDLIVKGMKDLDWGFKFQHEILNYRVEKIAGVKEFVTDRSPLDNLVYFLLQNTQSCSQRDCKEYIDLCDKAFGHFNGLIRLPFTKQIPIDDPIYNDGKRIVNKYYQILVNETFVTASGFIRPTLTTLNTLTIKEWDMDIRKDQTKLFLNHIQGLKEI